MPYQPALDGVRAVAVVMVLLFHAQLGWMPGGYLGVSVFFTLSGYLITSLLLDERARTGRIDMGRFYVRRIRRLLPASLLTIAGIGILTATGLIDARSTFRGDVLAALGQFKNWSAIVTEESYGDLFARSSPLDHFWSLSIEEQFYLVWPLTVVALAARAATAAVPTRRIAIACGALFAVAAVSAPVTAAVTSTNVVYLASWTRFAEILAGAVLAAALTGRALPRCVAALAPLALAGVLALGVASPAAAGWAYAGGLPLFAMLSVALLAGLQAPSRTMTLLSWSPLVWLGRISYGLYLYHWPVYVVLDEARTGLGGVRLLALRLAVTVALAALSAHLVELPVRRGRLIVSNRWLLAGAGTAAAALALVVAVTIPVRSPAPTAAAADVSALVAAPAGDPHGPASDGQATTQVVLFGDSVAHTMAGGVIHEYPLWDPWDPAQSMADPARLGIVSVAKPGCSYLPGDVAPLRPDGTRARGDLTPHCGDWRADTDAALEAAGPGAYLVVVLSNDIHDRWGPRGDVVAFGSASWVGLLETFLADLGTLASSHSSELVLVGLPPRVHPAPEGRRDRELAGHLADYAESRENVRYLDFGPAVESRPELFTDGLHYSRGGAAVFSDWLADRIAGE